VKLDSVTSRKLHRFLDCEWSSSTEINHAIRHSLCRLCRFSGNGELCEFNNLTRSCRELTPLRSSSASSEKPQVLNLREAAPAAQERFEFMSKIL
jgi:hypothetical protein